MKKFLFHPSEWRNNISVRSCTFEERGVLFDLLCRMTDSEKPGRLYITKSEMAAGSGTTVDVIDSLIEKGLIGGTDTPHNRLALVEFTPNRSGKMGPTVVLVDASEAPVWFHRESVINCHIAENRAGARSRSSRTTPQSPMMEKISGSEGSDA